MNSKVIISENIEELSECFAHQLIQDLDIGTKKINIALSGGSTPKVIFDFLSLNYNTKIDWNRINFFWGDERCVPPDNIESNYLMTEEHLFSKINIDRKNIFRIKGENDPETEADRYAETILNTVPRIGRFPVFDIVALGLGEDGHTASIFPMIMKLLASENICEVAVHPVTKQKRITMTGKVLNNAKKVIFFVTGKNKSEIIDNVLNRKNDYEKYPASHVNPVNGELIWLLDKNAASGLKGFK